MTYLFNLRINVISFEPITRDGILLVLKKPQCLSDIVFLVYVDFFQEMVETKLQRMISHTNPFILSPCLKKHRQVCQAKEVPGAEAGAGLLGINTIQLMCKRQILHAIIR